MQTELMRQSLQKEINDKRQESVIAARRGDYRAVAKLTTEVARLNQSLREASGSSEGSRHGSGLG